jgi:hypothetical protein
LIESLDPWLQWLKYSGLYHGLRGPPSVWANVHAGLILAILFGTSIQALYVYLFIDDPDSATGFVAPLGKITYLVVSCFDVALGLGFLSCVFFFRSEQRLQATFVILFQDNPLMRQPRLDFAIKLRKLYMPRVRLYSIIGTIAAYGIKIYILFTGEITARAVLYLIVFGIPLAYVAFVLATVMIIPFFLTIVHRFAIERMQAIITDPVTFAKCKTDMQDQIVKQTTDNTGTIQFFTSILFHSVSNFSNISFMNAAAFESGGTSDLMAVDSGYVSSSDGKFACVDELHYVLIMIRRHRQMLAEACAVQIWLFAALCLCLSFFAVSYISTFTYCILHWPMPHVPSNSLIEYGFFGILLTSLLLIFLYCVASVTQAYQQCTRAVLSRGCGALMRSAKQHAWQMQLLASTPEADFFQVMGLSVNFELVSRIGYGFVLFISYMMSSGSGTRT